MPKSRGRKPKKKRDPASAPKKRLDKFNTTPQELPLSTQPPQEPPLATAPRQEQLTPKIKQIAKLGAGHGHDGCERGLADLKWIAPEIVPVQFDQVEGVEEYAVVS